MHLVVRVCVLCLFAGLVSTAAEVPLHVTTSQDQEAQSLAQLGDGVLVAAWEDESVVTGRILFRRLKSSLAPLSAEQRLDLGPAGAERREPAVAALSSGGFVVVYSAGLVDADNYAVVFRRCNAAGSPLDPAEARANTIQAGAQFRPQVAGLTNGGFVICWVGQTGGTGQDVYCRRFSAAGAALDPADVLVNGLGTFPVTTGDQGSPRVAPLNDGGYVIVYEDRASGNVFAVRFSSAGVAQDAPGKPAGYKPILVPVSTAHEQSAPAVAGLAPGGFVVTYNTETNGTAASRRVLGRIFGADGAGGAEFTIGSHAARWQDARVAGLPNGDFAVAWQALTTETNLTSVSWAIFQQRFSRLGVPRGPAAKVNTFDNGNQNVPSVAGLVDGSCAIAWQSAGQDTSGLGVFAASQPAVVPSRGVLSIVRIPGSRVQVNFTGASGWDHDLQISTNLVFWTTIHSTNPASGSFSYPEPHSQPKRNYRVQTR